MDSAWGVVLSVIGIAIMWLAGNRRWEAWALGLFNQVLWVVFAITEGQPGFLIGAAAYATVYARNLVRWLRVA